MKQSDCAAAYLFLSLQPAWVRVQVLPPQQVLAQVQALVQVQVLALLPALLLVLVLAPPLQQLLAWLLLALQL
jgi:hypothetical protein